MQVSGLSTGGLHVGNQGTNRGPRPQSRTRRPLVHRCAQAFHRLSTGFAPSPVHNVETPPTRRPQNLQQEIHTRPQPVGIFVTVCVCPHRFPQAPSTSVQKLPPELSTAGDKPWGRAVDNNGTPSRAKSVSGRGLAGPIFLGYAGLRVPPPGRRRCRLKAAPRHPAEACGLPPVIPLGESVRARRGRSWPVVHPRCQRLRRGVCHGPGGASRCLRALNGASLAAMRCWVRRLLLVAVEVGSHAGRRWSRPGCRRSAWSVVAVVAMSAWVDFAVTPPRSGRYRARWPCRRGRSSWWVPPLSLVGGCGGQPCGGGAAWAECRSSIWVSGDRSAAVRPVRKPAVSATTELVGGGSAAISAWVTFAGLRTVLEHDAEVDRRRHVGLTSGVGEHERCLRLLPGRARRPCGVGGPRSGRGQPVT